MTIFEERFLAVVHAVRDVVTHAQIAALAPSLRRYAAGRHIAATDIDDLVQETLTRLLEVRDRLDLATLFSYALAVLTNLDRSNRRGDGVAHRHRHRLLDLEGPTSADDGLIQAEQQEALRQALAALTPDMRQLLLAHYSVDATPTTSTSGAQAARLARARAKLRVEYLLALRRITLPGPRCRAVLIAISERNTRRQTELAAGSHVASCPVCMGVADPLLRRESRLFGLWPLLGLAAVVRRAASSHPVAAAGAGVATAGVAATAVILALPGSPHQAPSRPSALCQLAGAGRASLVGHHIAATDAAVTSVPANEGFFVQTCRRQRVWVHLSGRGESPTHVRPRDEVSLAGVVRRVASNGVPRELSAADRAELRHSGVMLTVPFTGIRVSSAAPS
jgi:serine/threonine-protein kinase RsbT